MKSSLVLGGGAVRGLYHLGVLAAIRERGIVITDVAGCSAGALIGAIYAARPDDDIRDIVSRIELLRLIRVNLRGSGVFGTRKLEAMLRELIPATTFEQLRIPLTVVATDINTGEEVVFRKGPLLPALLASMAIPGVFPLVECDGKTLADGGIVNNLPVRHARTRTIIVSDVTFGLQPLSETAGKTATVLNAFYIMMRRSVDRELSQARASRKKMFILTLGKPIFAGDLRAKQRATLVTQGHTDALRVLPKR